MKPGGRRASPNGASCLLGDTADHAPASPRRPASAAGKTAEPTARVAQTPAAPSARVRTSQPRMEEDSEPGLATRIGQAMIAHPFLSLLVLVAPWSPARNSCGDRPHRHTAPPQVGPTVAQAPAPAFDRPADTPRSEASGKHRRAPAQHPPRRDRRLRRQGDRRSLSRRHAAQRGHRCHLHDIGGRPADLPARAHRPATAALTVRTAIP
jgi:hypothetical protein